MRYTTKYVITITKGLSYKQSEFCYQAVTTSIDDNPLANLEGRDVSASQYDIPALAFYINKCRKKIKDWGVYYEFHFPNERHIFADNSQAHVTIGLSEQEIIDFWKALNDPNNPDPH